MRDRELYARILGISDPWRVVEVDLDEGGREVRVRVELSGGARLCCPRCQARAKVHDTRERRWRHLDTCQFHTILVAKVPRVSCEEHGVRQIEVPWAEPNSRFTALYEALVIDWLKETSIAAVARLLDLSWDEVAGVQQRAVKRGLARRQLEPIRVLGVDETSFRKRHRYVTVGTDLERSRVVHVEDGHSSDSLARFFESLPQPLLEVIEVVAMDMWKPFILATKAFIPDADSKICFDKFHIAKHLGDAVDKVRREEHRRLMKEDDETLKGSKYFWLRNPDKMDDFALQILDALRSMNVKTGRAWAIRQMAMDLWHYSSRGWARKAWKRWLSWAMRCRLEPIKKVAKMVRAHLGGIINAVVHKVTNAGSESINAQIQRIKRRACGFRNRERFREAIYFHLGGLDLYPAKLSGTHTDS